MSKQSRVVVLSLLSFCAILLTSCGHDFWATNNSGSGGGSSLRFVYAGNLNNNGGGSVSEYTVGSGGALTSVTGSPVSAGSGIVSVATNSSGTFLFAANGSSSGGVYAFTVNRSSGALTAVSGNPFATGTSPVWVGVTPTATFVYVPFEKSGSSTE